MGKNVFIFFFVKREKNKMIVTFQKFWNQYGWDVIIYGTLMVLVVLWLYHLFMEKEGTYSFSSFQDIMDSVGSRESEKPVAIPRKWNSSGSSSKGEEICRQFLEYLYQKPFPKVRPLFLKNPKTKCLLELDCYNEELKIAVEYNGAQHYYYNPMMHNHRKENFEEQLYRDQLKQELCHENSVHLIIVPYDVDRDKISEFLYDALSQRHLLPPPPTTPSE